MRVAFVGCGYVFDTYMRTRWAHEQLEIIGLYDIDTARAAVVGKHYGIFVFADYAALLADPRIELVINLTSIDAHYTTTRAALEAGKHVYSEKPLTTDLDEARALFALAERHGVKLSGAPCNLFSDSVATMWAAIRGRAIGTPLLVYAELDDNPIYLMGVEHWRSSTGAPWPYVSEYEEGCTFEHIGYHLVWMCAMFGPAVSVVAYSDALVKVKTETPLDPSDTPDFSVACIKFANGVAARLTCSIVAPVDHRLRVIGDEGEISIDSYRHYQAPVRLERFSSVSLNARKSRTVRLHTLLGRWFGVGGQRLPLVRHWKSHATEAEPGTGRRSLKQWLKTEVRRREVYSQDKLLGVAEMARAIGEAREVPMPADFMLHITELTLLVQRAGIEGIALVPTTTFAAVSPLPTLGTPRDYRRAYRPRFLERRLGGAVDSLHKH